MHDKERLIREKRKIEATKKNLMGAGGKLGCIVKYLGEPIRDHGSTFGVDSYDNIDYFDFYENEEENEGIPVFDDEEPVTIGYIFDGLRFGMHLEIRYLDESKELLVTYSGNAVYREISSELMAYVPDASWEKMVDRLYKAAKKVREKSKDKEKASKKIQGQKLKQSFLDRLKKLWGV